MTQPPQEPELAEQAAEPTPRLRAPQSLDQVATLPPRCNRTGRIIGAVVGGAVLLVVVTVAVTLALTSPAKPRTIQVNGTFTLNDSASAMSTTGQCSGYGEYDDIRRGTQVVVTDPAGTVIGLGHLESGTPSGKSCMFSFTIMSVPAGKSFYGMTVSHRNTLQYAESQLKDTIGITLGNGS